MNTTERPDFLIIGGGIIGITTGIELRRRFPDCSVVLIEKEGLCGLHASGRNSGVLHAGFYYSGESLKARFCREGNRRLTEYCLDRDLPINRSGKLVVPRSEDEIGVLETLLHRGVRNGVEVHLIDEVEAESIDPRVVAPFGGLWSPTTSTIDPVEVTVALATDFRNVGGRIITGAAFIKRNANSIVASDGMSFDPGFVVNAAGAYADRIASAFGAGRRYRILPIRGRYLVAPQTERLQTNVYPVPEMRMPVLGLHLTLGVAGSVTIGPTALMAGWREHYGGLSGFDASEFRDVLSTQMRLWLKNEAGFRAHTLGELKKLSRSVLVAQASTLVKGLAPFRQWNWGNAGIRAQLVDRATGSLKMDFVVEIAENSLHVMNAVSPAFTSSLSFSAYLVDLIEGKTGLPEDWTP